ncbi:MAG: hypothetical protein Q8Q28_10000 [Pseudomonadota bacterium]|nr:hypothetical protein [Pseudomonadota bacterium]
MSSAIALLPDAGPLITLAYAEALDLLLQPGWTVEIVDMVLHEVTRNETPTSRAIGEWVAARRLPIRATQLFRQYQVTLAEAASPPAKANLGEFAIQEAMNQFAVLSPPRTGVFLFEDHKIARAGFLLPDNARKVSTRAFLLFLEQRGWLDSAAEIERRAIQNGRSFSRLRFPPA